MPNHNGAAVIFRERAPQYLQLEVLRTIRERAPRIDGDVPARWSAILQLYGRQQPICSCANPVAGLIEPELVRPTIYAVGEGQIRPAKEQKMMSHSI
jgi:hypothetical protein